MRSEKKPLFANVKDGETFMVDGMEFIKFPSVAGKTPVMMKDIAFISSFGANNNFAESKILQRMQNEILPKIIKAVGEDNVCTFKTDLTTLDGLKPYSDLESKISVYTLDFYRAHADIFQKYKVGRWCWTATPESARPNDNPWYVLCVAPSGFVNFDNYYDDGIGVRPFCIFESSIFGSFET